MTVTPYVYNQFSAIVASVAIKMGYAVKYMWGHPLEVSEQLDQLSKMPAKAATKYPLIALFTDISESRGTEPSIEAEVKVHLIIAVNTLIRYTSAERLTKNFIPILYPVYDQLLKSIAESGYYTQGRVAKLIHTKTDRFRYGKTGIYANTGEIFKDKIDCIEIENLNLSIIKQTCKNDSNIK
jgi:hypothetical protein